MSKLKKIRFKIISLLLTEDEKCIINQGLNEARQQVKNDLYAGLATSKDAYSDIEIIDNLNEVVKNALWN